MDGGDSNLEGAVYASVSSDIDIYSAECRGSLCKLYASASTSEGYDDLANESFIESMNELLEGNVNIYFDEEGGQQVIYVESID